MRFLLSAANIYVLILTFNKYTFLGNFVLLFFSLFALILSYILCHVVYHVIITWSDPIHFTLGMLSLCHVDLRVIVTWSYPLQHHLPFTLGMLSLSLATTPTTQSLHRYQNEKTTFRLSPQWFLPIFDFWGPLHPMHHPFFKFWARGLSPLLLYSRWYTTDHIQLTNIECFPTGRVMAIISKM